MPFTQMNPDEKFNIFPDDFSYKSTNHSFVVLIKYLMT